MQIPSICHPVTAITDPCALSGVSSQLRVSSLWPIEGKRDEWTLVGQNRRPDAMITPLRAIGMTKDHAHREEGSAVPVGQKCNSELDDVLADEQSHGQNSGESEAAEERRIGQEMKAVVESDEIRVRGQQASVDEGSVQARRKEGRWPAGPVRPR